MCRTLDIKFYIIFWIGYPKTLYFNLSSYGPSSRTHNQNHLQSTLSMVSTKITKQVSEFRKLINRTPKRKLIDKIIFEYWTQGLNLLQISQIDCQLIVDKSNSAQSWIYSTVKDMHDKIVPISINPREF